MSQINIRKDIKVVCEPEIDHLSFLRQSKTIADRANALFTEAERIRNDIRRHCDDANPRIVYTTVTACEFCGDESEWVNEDPACCQESLDDFLKQGNAYIERMGL